MRVAQALRGDLRRRGMRRLPRGPRPSTVANSAGLTPRQLDVLALLGRGMSNIQIANRLAVSARTIDHHMSAIMAKLHVQSRSQALVVAYRENLVSQRP